MSLRLLIAFTSFNIIFLIIIPHQVFATYIYEKIPITPIYNDIISTARLQLDGSKIPYSDSIFFNNLNIPFSIPEDRYYNSSSDSSSSTQPQYKKIDLSITDPLNVYILFSGGGTHL